MEDLSPLNPAILAGLAGLVRLVIALLNSPLLGKLAFFKNMPPIVKTLISLALSGVVAGLDVLVTGGKFYPDAVLAFLGVFALVEGSYRLQKGGKRKPAGELPPDWKPNPGPPGLIEDALKKEKP